MTTICTCRTDGCPNAGIGIPMELSGTDAETGESWEVTSVQCGPCGQPITDTTNQEGSNDDEA